jgi:Caspase domain
MKIKTFLPIAIDTYTPVGAGPPRADRMWFKDLTGVAADATALSKLLTSERYHAEGFRVKQRISGTFEEVRTKLTEALGEMEQPQEDNALVVLWSGHGECLATGELRLACRGDQTPMRSGQGYSPVELAKQLVSPDCPFVYLILDVCHAGAAADNIHTAFKTTWDASAPAFKSLGILCAAGAASRARDAGVVPILIRLLKEGPSEAAKKIFEEQGGGYWSERDLLLSPYHISSAADAEAKATNLPRVVALLAGDFRLFPNPLYKKDGLPQYADRARLAFLSADAETHFLPKARGLDPAEPGWFFTGRVGVNRRLIDHLSKPGPGTIVALTGDGGTGKSAILGRLAILSDRDAARRAGWTETDNADDTVPPPGWVSAAVHLRGLTAQQATKHLGEILQVPEATRDDFDVGHLLKFIRKTDPPLVAFDALDESLEPSRISNDLILPLARMNWRVLVGTRRSASAHGATDLLGPFLKLEGAYCEEDLTREDSTPADIAAYVAGRLVQTPSSPYYCTADDRDARQIAHAVSRKAARVFLYARITADSLVRRGEPLNLSPGWEDRELGLGLDGAFAKDLAEFDRRFHERFGREDDFTQASDGATALMRALAWGRGEGLPLWNDIWPRLASAVNRPRIPFRREHAEWILFEAGRYILEAGESEQAVYRLFHQSLIDFFRRNPAASEMEGRAFEGLCEVARSNRNPNPYIRRYLAHHATAANRLQEILEDVWLLVLCEPFLQYCLNAKYPSLESVLQVYRAVAHRLGSEPTHNAAHL